MPSRKQESACKTKQNAHKQIGLFHTTNHWRSVLSRTSNLIFFNFNSYIAQKSSEMSVFCGECANNSITTKTFSNLRATVLNKVKIMVSFMPNNYTSSEISSKSCRSSIAAWERDRIIIWLVEKFHYVLLCVSKRVIYITKYIK